MPSISSDLPGDDGDDDSGSSLFGSPRNAGVVDDEFIQNQLQMLQSRATPRAAPAKQPLLSQVVIAILLRIFSAMPCRDITHAAVRR
eukprot:3939143-Rhodomonas_salina.10